MGGSPTSAAAGWDGTNWTSLPNLNSGRDGGVAFGTKDLAVYAGGSPATAATEEWTGPGVAVTKTITVS